MSNRLTIGECFGVAGQVYRRHLLKATAGNLLAQFPLILLILTAFLLPSSSEPTSEVSDANYTILLVLILVFYIAEPALFGGLQWFSEKLIRSEEPRYGDVFAGFRRYFSLLGYYILLSLPLFLFGGAFVIHAALFGTNSEGAVGPMFTITVLLILAVSIAWLVFSVRFRVAPAGYIKDPEVTFLRGLKNSSRQTTGNFREYLLVHLFSYVVSFTLTVAVIIICFVGHLFLHSLEIELLNWLYLIVSLPLIFGASTYSELVVAAANVKLREGASRTEPLNPYDIAMKW